MIDIRLDKDGKETFVYMSKKDALWLAENLIKEVRNRVGSFSLTGTFDEKSFKAYLVVGPEG